MAEIIKVYRQSLPAVKLVGRRYGEADSTNGSYAGKWGEWFRDNLFAPLELPGNTEDPFEDAGAYIGLCRIKEGEPFQYWIGVLLPPEAAVPEGYDSMPIDAGDFAVCWIYGQEPDIYMTDCTGCLAENGYKWKRDKDGALICFERYACPRYTTPDDKGNIILDMCFSI